MRRGKTLNGKIYFCVLDAGHAQSHTWNISFESAQKEIERLEQRLAETEADARALEKALEIARPYVAVAYNDSVASGSETSTLDSFRLQYITLVLSEHGAKYLEQVR